MIEFPPAKLNLGLQIIAKRTDGFHDLQTVFYQFPLNDVLEIIKDDSLEPGHCSFISTGLPIPNGENLCEKAYKLLHEFHPLLSNQDCQKTSPTNYHHIQLQLQLN